MTSNSHNHIIISQQIDPVRILQFQEVERSAKSKKKIIVVKFLKGMKKLLKKRYLMVRDAIISHTNCILINSSYSLGIRVLWFMIVVACTMFYVKDICHRLIVKQITMLLIQIGVRSV